jgi:hypothetical protein
MLFSVTKRFELDTRMRKAILPREMVGTENWLNLSAIAQVEVTSEDPAFPIEAAIGPPNEITSAGWRAAESGEQHIKLVFDTPQQIRRIIISFQETRCVRTQQFMLRWSPDGNAWHEIVRQQWNFSPESSPNEVEDYRVELVEVLVLELVIIPNISGGDSRASLAALRIQ